MRHLTILETSRRLSILCLGAHCDDLDIGCGGALLAGCVMAYTRASSDVARR